MPLVPSVADSQRRLGSADHPLRALLVDRQPLFLAALGSLLSAPPINATVRTFTRSDTALEALSDFQADLVLCEARAVPLSGPELAGRLTDQSPPIKVVLLADEQDDAFLQAAIRSGATGFFTKASSPDEFLEGVEAVLAGLFVVARSLVNQGLTAVISNGLTSVEHPPPSFSVSERGILTMVGRAHTIASISVERGVSQKTVRYHLSNIYRKLGVRNRTEAILCAARLGLVDADAPGPD